MEFGGRSYSRLERDHPLKVSLDRPDAPENRDLHGIHRTPRLVSWGRRRLERIRYTCGDPTQTLLRSQSYPYGARYRTRGTARAVILPATDHVRRAETSRTRGGVDESFVQRHGVRESTLVTGRRQRRRGPRRSIWSARTGRIVLRTHVTTIDVPRGQFVGRERSRDGPGEDFLPSRTVAHWNGGSHQRG